MENLVNEYLKNNDKVKDFLGMLEKFLTEIKSINDNFKDNTLLHAAVLNKDLKTVTLILDILNSMNYETKTKYINAQNKDGNTAIHNAANLCGKCQLNSDENKTCEAIATLLDKNGAIKTIPNNQGEIVGVSDKSPTISGNNSPLSHVSEYRSNILNFTGGFFNSNSSSPSNSYLSRLIGGNKNNLSNISTEVSVDKYTKSKKPLENMYTEVSVDQLVKDENVSSSDVSSFSESSNGYNQNGGNNMLSDTSNFVKTLLNQFNSSKGGAMKGGFNNTSYTGGNQIRGQRNLPSLSDYAITDSSSELYGGKEFGLSREQMKESSNIHDQVVQIFIDSGKSEEDARIMKMALYKYTKDHNPDLNNLDRAKKMKEYAEDKSVIKKLDLESSRKIYEENKKAKSQMSSESKMSTEKSTTEMTEEVSSEDESEESSEKPKKKTTKKTTKKETKKSKK